jgi:replicative DNA helicase
MSDGSETPQASQAPRSLDQELAGHAEHLVRGRGRALVGLGQGSIVRLDRSTLGLRGLMLLAAAPNVGKTTLAMQLGLDVVRMNPEACLLFVSLEMSRADIMTRLLCNLSRLDWKTVIMGEDGLGEGGGMPSQLDQALAQAQTDLAELGRRILILDEENYPRPTIEGLVAQLKGLKARSGASRALILVDYLQVFPLPGGPEAKAMSERDADMWRVGALKSLRDASGEAVLAISEVSKPAPGQAWAGALSDIAGSSRAIYTPDMVFLLQTLSEEESLRQIGGDPRAAKQQMQQLGIAFLRLAVAKGRDGVVRDTINLTFYHRQSRFAEGFRGFI